MNRNWQTNFTEDEVLELLCLVNNNQVAIACRRIRLKVDDMQSAEEELIKLTILHEELLDHIPGTLRMDIEAFEESNPMFRTHYLEGNFKRQA